MSYTIHEGLMQIIFVALIAFFCYIVFYSDSKLSFEEIVIIAAIFTVAGYGLWTTTKKGRKKK